MSTTFAPEGGNPAVSSLVGQVAQATGWSPQLLQSQFNLETAYGTSPVWAQDNNPAGIKYTGAPGQSVGAPASDGGNYAKFADPAQGWISFIQNNPRYANVAGAGSPAEQAALLQADGWSTNPSYAQTLDQMMGVTPYAGALPSSFTSESSSSSDSPTYGVKGLGGTFTAIGWTIGGIALGLAGIWLLFNPFADLTRVISGTAKQLGASGQKLAQKPVRGAVNRVSRHGGALVHHIHRVAGP